MYMESSVDIHVYVVDFVDNRIYHTDIAVYRRRPFDLSSRCLWILSLSHLLRNRNHLDAIVQFDEQHSFDSMMHRMNILHDVSQSF